MNMCILIVDTQWYIYGNFLLQLSHVRILAETIEKPPRNVALQKKKLTVSSNSTYQVVCAICAKGIRCNHIVITWGEGGGY